MVTSFSGTIELAVISLPPVRRGGGLVIDTIARPLERFKATAVPRPPRRLDSATAGLILGATYRLAGRAALPKDNLPTLIMPAVTAAAAKGISLPPYNWA